MHPEDLVTFRPKMSAKDWKKVRSAIAAYSHNPEYRELLARLECEAKINGITRTTLRSS